MRAGAWSQDHEYLVKLKCSTTMKQIALLATPFNLLAMEEYKGQENPRSTGYTTSVEYYCLQFMLFRKHVV